MIVRKKFKILFALVVLIWSAIFILSAVDFFSGANVLGINSTEDKAFGLIVLGLILFLLVPFLYWVVNREEGIEKMEKMGRAYKKIARHL